MDIDKKYDLEVAIEEMIPYLFEHGRLFYNNGWDELVETYTEDDIFNTLFFNHITNLDDAILFFDNRFNPTDSGSLELN